MPSLEITVASQRFERLLGKYLETNTRNAGDLVARKAQSVAKELYNVCSKLAPSEAEIAQKVKSLGWRVKRKKGAWPLRQGEKRGSTGPLHRMQAAQIGRRQKARGYVATGWLPAVNRLGGAATGGKKRLVQVKNPRGKVKIEGGGTGTLAITITNQTPGIGKMQREHNVIRTALNNESADIIKYLRDHQVTSLARVKS